MNEYRDSIPDHLRLWNECLTIIKDNIPGSAFDTWFIPIVPQRWENSTLTISVPSQFYAEFLEEHYCDLLKRVFSRVMGAGVKLRYEVLIENKQKTTVEVDGGRSRLYSSQSSNRFDPFSVQAPLRIDSQLNPNYTFDSFVEGPCNKLARSAGKTIAQNPGNNPFNPMFIYGGSGLGKTHLAHAIGLATLELHPEKNVLYVDANKFQVQYTDAVRGNKVNDFVNFYQQIDLLIIDDIHSFSGKTGTQNTFFQIFNHLHQSGKQLILTSDCSPKLLQGVDQRMLSRFRWGLNAELETPSQDTRKAILRTKVKSDGLVIPDEVVDYIAERVTDNVRELEGVIVSLLAQSTLTDAEINLDLAERVVSKTIGVEETNITIHTIQKAVCDYYSLNLNEIQTKSRKREVVQARQIAMYLARKYTKNSLSSIGEQIGNRDHATVLYACKAVSDLIDVNKSFRQSLDVIESSLK